MKQYLKELFDKYDIEHTEQMLDCFVMYYNIVIEENKKFNLTAITEKNDFALKHFLDCCLPYKILPQNASVIDIGAGAGFPSIPLKIIRPDLKITMLDSLNKRVNFLNNTVAQLGLKEIFAVHSRAEDYAQKNREVFDIAIARAVANLNTLSEYCLPFVKAGGKFIALKGSSFQEELNISNNAIKLLGGNVQDIQIVELTENDSTRANIVVEKVSATPNKYPRGKNLPKDKPLM
ncbi:MAG: 16S rRNA (guanine(527)-N(7))-methyltransferase RsmG [Clostridiales bacterium]|nr:16S rRNA (guanine(527)-N(7))-methyltransferase RsmG [Clostridiales bacterium]